MMTEGPRLPQLTPAIKHLMIVNAIVFGLNAILFGRLSAPAGDVAGGFWFAFSWDLATDGYGLGLLRLISYQFTHSFTDAWHFFGNMMVLYFMGTLAEPRLGYRGTIKLYLVGGICGALMHLGLAVLQGYHNVPLVGASGACYSFLVYAACRYPNAMVFNFIPLWALTGVLVFVAFYQTFIGLAGGFSGGVAHSAHLGGAILGFFAFRKNLFVDWAGDYGNRPGFLSGMMQNVKQAKVRRQAEAQQAQDLQMDEILAKVKAEGLSSLTAGERKFLEKASKQAQK